jgi:phage replication-related protein YjqB (UPF0714/DUF867 family)
MPYACYNDLRKNHHEGTEYIISETEVLSNTCLFFSHGGGIEPGTSELVHHVALAIHGESAEDCEATYLGGRNLLGKRFIRESLRASGFNVPDETPQHLLGQERNNICNRCATGEGIQIEITSKQRQQFFCGDLNTRSGRKIQTAAFVKYVDAIRAASREIENECGSH